MGLAIAVMPRPAGASELLDNGGFEVPGTWQGAPDASVDTTVSDSGDASWSIPVTTNPTLLQQFASDFDAATVDATVAVRADVVAFATLELRFYGTDLGPLGFVTSPELAVGGTGAFTTIVLDDRLVPPGAARVRFSISVQATGTGGTAWIDSASLFGTPAPAPTETPVPPTSTFTPTATATPTPSSSPTATSATPGSTTATSTATGTATPTATNTSAPQPAPPQSGAGIGPVGFPPTFHLPGPAPEPDTSGGLLANGSFELNDGAAPTSWAKIGGTLFTSADARTGNFAVSHLSQSDSTKWIYQTVVITPGEWYEFTAWARRESGDGEAFLRLSFYEHAGASGSTIHQADSTSTVTAPSWTFLTTGPVKAPPTAKSVRVRLMIRPSGPFSAAFDDATLFKVEAPVATPTATATISATPTPTKTPGPGATSATKTATPRPRAGAVQPFAGLQSPATSLRINEIVYDGDGDPDHAYEWVELYNHGNEPVSLAGWQIGDANSFDDLPAATLDPGAYVVVVGSEFAGAVGATVVHLGNSRIGSGLNNDGDTVVLLDPSGATVDAISYGDDGAVAGGPGQSVGITLGGEWLATLRPTPGSPNEFPSAISETTPGSAPKPPTVEVSGVAATPGPTVEAEAIDDHTPRAANGGDNPAEWLVLGAALGVGGLAAATTGRRRLNELLEKRRAR